MDYQVTLPDHDFVVAPKDKLIPSVTGDMKLVKSKFRCYIHRYQKCQVSASSAFTHFQDEDALSAMSFETDRHEEKNVMIDGGSDENLRYEKL